MRKVVCAEKHCEVCNKLFLIYWHRRESARYCSQDCYRKSSTFGGFEKKHTKWNHPNVIKNRFQSKGKNGKWKDSNGYIHLYKPDHFGAKKNGCVLEHRYIMEIELRRKLLPNEHVHHINGRRDDNRLCNLEVLTNVEHGKKHYSMLHSE